MLLECLGQILMKIFDTDEYYRWFLKCWKIKQKIFLHRPYSWLTWNEMLWIGAWYWLLCFLSENHGDSIDQIFWVCKVRKQFQRSLQSQYIQCKLQVFQTMLFLFLWIEGTFCRGGTVSKHHYSFHIMHSFGHGKVLK